MSYRELHYTTDLTWTDYLEKRFFKTLKIKCPNFIGYDLVKQIPP